MARVCGFAASNVHAEVGECWRDIDAPSRFRVKGKERTRRSKVADALRHAAASKVR